MKFTAIAMIRHPICIALLAFYIFTGSGSAVGTGIGFQVDASNASELRRCRGEKVTVMGRVISGETVEGQQRLVLEGGHLCLVIAVANEDQWVGRLIEVAGNVEDLPGAREGGAALKIFLRTADTIRVIPETAAGAASCLVVRKQPENLHWWFHQPPGPAPAAPALAASPSFRDEQLWKRVDGTTARFAFHSWKWRPRLGRDMKTPEWVVSLSYAPDSRNIRWFYPEDMRLAATEEERLRVMLWKHYGITRKEAKMQKPEAAPPVPDGAMAATEAWVGRITHWGETPLTDDSRVQRLPGPGDFGNLPDARKLTEVKLRRASPQGRQHGKLVLLDWGMTAEATAEKVPARIRWEDGLEETVPALDLFPHIVHRSSLQVTPEIDRHHAALLLMQDWACAGQRREKLPGRELKIRAVRQFLKYWWDSPVMTFMLAQEQLRLKEQEAMKTAAAAAAPADLVQKAPALNAPFRSGYQLEFPGLPPEGCKELPVTMVDRTLLKPVTQTIGKKRMDDTVANMISSMLWWDAAGVMPLPEKWGKRRREEMLAQQAERYLKGGFTRDRQHEVCHKMLEGRYFLQRAVDGDFSPANLARYAEGHHAVMLHLSVWDAREYRFPLRLLIHTCTPDGNLTFSTWGETGTGMLKTTDLNPGMKLPRDASGKARPCYQLELSGSAALLEYLKSKAYRLVLDSWKQNYIEAVTPWRMDSAAAPEKK